MTAKSSTEHGKSSLKKIPLRLVLIVPFVVQIFAIVGLIGYLSFLQGRKAVNDLASQLMEKSGQQVSEHLDKYLALPQQLIQMNADAIIDGQLNLNDQKASERYFWRQAKAFKNLNYIGYSLPDGRETGAGRWINGIDLLMYENLGRNGKASDYIADSQGNRAKLLQSYELESLLLTPYVGAVKAGKLIWGEIFIFEATNLQVTESGKALDNHNSTHNIGYENYVALPIRKPVYSSDKNLTAVVSVDILLTEISIFLSKLKVSSQGQVFIIERDGLLIGASNKSSILNKINGKTQRYNALQSSNLLIRNTADNLHKKFNSFQTIKSHTKTNITFNQEHYYVQVEPWGKEYGLDWLVVIAVPESNFMGQIYASTRTTIILCTTALFIAILIGIYTSRYITQPILRLSEASEDIAIGKLNQTIPNNSINEVNILGHSFNRMAQQLRDSFSNLEQINLELENRVIQRTEKLSQALEELKQTQAHLVQAEKMSSLGQMVAGVAHEINNPVNFIHGNLSHIDDYTQELLELIQVYQLYIPNPDKALQEIIDRVDLNFIIEDLNKIIGSMSTGTNRIREIVLSLRNFSRLDEAECKEANIHEGIDSTLMILQHRLKANSNHLEIQVIKEYGELPLVNCYAGQLNQVFMNILANAIDALEDLFINHQDDNSANNPTIWIHTQLTDQGNILVSIADNGAGIPENVKSKLFDPFFTTKPVGQGTGLGLYISYQIIVQKHNGKMYCDSKLGKGTKFVIEIPIHFV